MAHIVLNPFGSFGDLHPYLAIALELKRRGHEPVIATSTVYREKVEAEGLGFSPVRPDVSHFIDRPDLIARLWHPSRGTDYLLRDFLIPEVKEAYADLLPACKSADLLLTHMAAFAGPIVGEKLSIPWFSVALQPGALFSVHDPMVLPQAPQLRHLYQLGTWFTRALFAIGEVRTNGWARPIHNLRRDLQMPRGRSPVMYGQFSPHGTLALFSKWFATPQPDWPPHTHQPGFLFYDHAGAALGTPGSEARLSRKLQAFLDAGDPPILFTLGSSAVLHAGRFFEESRKAAEMLGRRAILLVGQKAQTAPGTKDIFIAPYLPFSEVMPHASAIVHQGGIGTTGQTLRAGKPALVVPWSHDQPDNGNRLRRLGVARVLNRKRYTAASAAAELEKIHSDPSMFTQAEMIGREIRNEQATEAACDAIEELLR